MAKGELWDVEVFYRPSRKTLARGQVKARGPTEAMRRFAKQADPNKAFGTVDHIFLAGRVRKP